MDIDNPKPYPALGGFVVYNPGDAMTDTHKSEPPRRTAREIERWFVDYLANLPERESNKEIDVTVPFENFALDSITALGMTGDLEEWLGRSVDPTMVYDYPTIEQFSRYLAEQDGV